MELLKDLKPDGRERKWAEKKQNSLLLAESFQRLHMDSTAANVFMCGRQLEFHVYSDTHERQLTNAIFCHNKLCPLCNWRRSLKIFSQMSRIMDVIQSANDYRYIFMTLTVKNVSGNDLFDTTRKLITDFHHMVTHYDAFKCFHGYVRVLEITYSKKNNDYHPHLHIIFACSKRYFKSKDYISQKKLSVMWQKSANLDYTPVVDVRKVVNKLTGEDHGKALGSAVAEISKYPVKDADYLKIDVKGRKGERDIQRIDNVVFNLYVTLYRLKLVSMAGCFRDAQKKLKLGDVEDGDLTDKDILREDVKYVIERYSWSAGLKNYVLLERSHDRDGSIDVERDD